MASYQKSAYLFLFLFLSITYAQAFPSFFSSGDDSKDGVGAVVNKLMNNVLPFPSLKKSARSADEDAVLEDEAKKKDTKDVKIKEDADSQKADDAGEADNSSKKKPSVIPKITLPDLPNIAVPSLSGKPIRLPTIDDSSEIDEETLDAINKLPAKVSDATNLVANFTNNSAESLYEATAVFMNATKDLNNTADSYKNFIDAGVYLNRTLEEFYKNLTEITADITNGTIIDAQDIVQKYVLEGQKAIQAILNAALDNLERLLTEATDTVKNATSTASEAINDLTSTTTELVGDLGDITKNVTLYPLTVGRDMLETIISGLGNFSNALFGINAAMDLMKKGPNGKEESLASLFIGQQNKTDDDEDADGLKLESSIGLRNIPFSFNSLFLNARGLQDALLLNSTKGLQDALLLNSTKGLQDALLLNNTKGLGVDLNEAFENLMDKNLTNFDLTNMFSRNLKDLLNQNLTNILNDNTTGGYATGLLKDGRDLINNLKFLQVIGNLTSRDDKAVQNLTDNVQSLTDNLLHGEISLSDFQDKISELGESLTKFSNSSLKNIAEQPMEKLNNCGNYMMNFDKLLSFGDATNFTDCLGNAFNGFTKDLRGGLGSLADNLNGLSNAALNATRYIGGGFVDDKGKLWDLDSLNKLLSPDQLKSLGLPAGLPNLPNLPNLTSLNAGSLNDLTKGALNLNGLTGDLDLTGGLANLGNGLFTSNAKNPKKAPKKEEE